MGGGASQYFAGLAGIEDGVKCVAPVHATNIDSSVRRRINVPVMILGSTDDSCCGGSVLYNDYSRLDVPVVYPLLRGGPHVRSGCGNSCPGLIWCCVGGRGNTLEHTKWIHAFFQVYLMGRTDVSPLIWDQNSRGGLWEQPELASVRVLPRIRLNPTADDGDVVSIRGDTSVVVKALAGSVFLYSSSSRYQVSAEILDISPQCRDMFSLLQTPTSKENPEVFGAVYEGASTASTGTLRRWSSPKLFYLQLEVCIPKNGMQTSTVDCEINLLLKNEDDGGTVSNVLKKRIRITG